MDALDESALPSEVEAVGRRVLDVAFLVHRAFGPGAMESLYARALARGLEKRGLHVRREVTVPVVFEGETIHAALRADLLVEDTVLVEVKAVQGLHAVHLKQVVTYLRLTGKPLGYLINFDVALLKDGIRRFVNTRGSP